MTEVTLVVVGADADDLRAFDQAHAPQGVCRLELVDNSLAPRGYGAIGNTYLEAPAAQVLGLCHADTGFGPGAIAALADAAAGGALAGVAGRVAGGGIRWCDGAGEGPGPVSTLDSCAIFLRPDLGLRFDTETFDGLHCCVEDLCLQARAAGVPSVVPAAQAGHRGQSTFDPRWQAEYRGYRQRLADKWRGVRFETT